MTDECLQILFSEIDSNIERALEKGTSRLFHGRGGKFEAWKSINIDYFDGLVWLVDFKSHGSDVYKALKAHLERKLSSNFKTLVVQDRSDAKSPRTKCYGDIIDSYVTSENGLKFNLCFGDNQNSGLFVDSSPVREYIRENSKSKSVLNLFSYTCANSVYALAGEAETILNVDLSRSSLSIGRENHLLNNQLPNNVQFQGWNVMKSFNGIKNKGPFDLMIIDPPTHQSGSFKAKRDYPKLLRKCTDWLRPSAQVVLCLNDPVADESQLKSWVEAEAPALKWVKKILPPEPISNSENPARPHFELFRNSL